MELREIQKAELAILKEFAAFCDKNGLRYYLAGGTLLGAVRHRGFIPWDDDVDVIMPRPDYERFLALAHRKGVGKYGLVDDYHGDFRAMPFAKLESPDIRAKSQLMCTRDKLWIDIFPMDGMPAEEGELRRHMRRIAWYNYELWQSRSAEQEIRNPVKRLAKRVIFFHFRRKGMLYYSRKLTACARHYPYEGAEYVGCAVGKYGRKERIRKAEFEGRIRMPFEGEMFFVSEGYDRYLTNLYGDYMRIPDEDEKRIHFRRENPPKPDAGGNVTQNCRKS